MHTNAQESLWSEMHTSAQESPVRPVEDHASVYQQLIRLRISQMKHLDNHA